MRGQQDVFDVNSWVGEEAAGGRAAAVAAAVGGGAGTLARSNKRDVLAGAVDHSQQRFDLRWSLQRWRATAPEVLGGVGERASLKSSGASMPSAPRSGKPWGILISIPMA